MIIFHEGLPRSGKSYEATKEHIVPALKNRRKVFARINGIDHQKFAELAELTIEECQALLIPITEEQVHTIYQVVENDSMVVIDELQNFFPSGRSKLSDEMTKFVTEHGHRGLDIICMGQSLADCHNIWRRRVQRKIQFLKLDMLGRENRYKWTAYQGAMKPNGEIDFTKINSGTKNYDPAYFGAYASHQADTENKGNLADGRLNVFNSSLFKFGLPGVIAVACLAVWYLFQFFGGGVDVVPVTQANTSQVNSSQANTSQVNSSQAKNQPAPKPKDWDFVMENSQRYATKITYLSQYNGFVYDALVVWVDSDNRVVDQLYKADLIDLGYQVSGHSYGLKVVKGKWFALFRWAPVHDSYAAVPQQTQQQLADDSKG